MQKQEKSNRMRACRRAQRIYNGNDCTTGISSLRSVTGGNHTAKPTRNAKSKNLRTFDAFLQVFGAKILRLASLAQDDRLGRLCDKLKIDHRSSGSSGAGQ